MFTPIALDKPRNLRYDIQACINMETYLGMSLGQIVASLRTVNITTIRGALWAGLQHEEPDITIPDTTKLLQEYGDKGGSIVDVTNAINMAIAKSTPLNGTNKSAGNVKPKAKQN